MQLPATHGESLPVSANVLIVFAIFELGLAAWIVFGIWPHWSRWIPSACFAGFAMVALYQALSGAESCGCFGRMKVNPWITFTMDVVLAGALWKWPPGRGLVRRAADEGRCPWRRAAVMGCVLPVVLVMSLRQLPSASAVAEAAEKGTLLEAGGLTILDPGTWVDKQLPLIGHTDVDADISQGRWLVVLHQAHCSTCREALTFYEALAGTAAGYRVALLEIPPYDGEHGEASAALWGRLSDEREWFASTPVVLLLEKGIVKDAAEGKAAVALGADWERMKLVPGAQANVGR